MNKTPGQHAGCWFALGVTIGLVTVWAGSVRAMDQTSADNLATNILAQSGRKGGVWAVPHCGSGELVVALWNKTGQSRLMIDAFENDPVILASAQQKVDTLGLLGRNVYVYQGSTLARMPYADNFVDLIVITGLTDADLSTVSYAEIERSLDPGGKAWVGRAAAEGAGLSVGALTDWVNAGTSGTNALSSAVVVTDAFGTWAVVTKINKLPGADEWPGNGSNHYGKDAGNNRYSIDTKGGGGPKLPQWRIGPYSDFKGGGNGRTWSLGVSGGRYYRMVTHDNQIYLSVSRFFNGEFLWEKSVGNGVPYFTPDYCVAGLAVYDAETGAQVKTIPSSNFPASFGGVAEMFADQNTIYMVGDKTDSVSLVKYDLANDSMSYCVLLPSSLSRDRAWGSALANGNIYFVNHDGVYCYSAETGNYRWGPKIGTLPLGNIVGDTGYNLVASKWGVMAVSGSNYNGTESATFFSADDGTVVWDKTTISATAYLNDNFSPTQTGFVFTHFAGGCGGAWTASPRGTWGQPGPGGAVPYRTSCNEAPWPCNGMLLFPPRGCSCSVGFVTMPGTSVEAMQGTFSPEVEIAGSERLEPGPVYTNWTPAITTDDLDWFTHRGNNKRSAYSPVILPATPQLLWQYHNPNPAVVSDVYSTVHKVTSPVTAGNYVYFAGSDGIVKCLNSRTGGLVWNYVTGGDIFTAPTVWNGGVYVGSGDGYAYCLEAHTGKLRWRFRAAPTERRMNDWGHLISSWPLIGGVLVQDGYAYFASGIYDEFGAQVFKVNALTGDMVWQNTRAGVFLKQGSRRGLSPVGTMTIAVNKLWVKSRDTLCMGFDLATGEAYVPPERFAFDGTCNSGGADIGVVGDYLILGGRSVYFRDGALGTTMIKLHNVYGQVYPMPVLPDGYGMAFWNDQSYAGIPMQVLTATCDGAISRSGPLDYTVYIGLPPASKGIAGSANACIYDPTDEGGKVRTSLGWISPSFPSTVTYANPMAIDRNGNIVVTLKNGDVLCYASTVPTIYLAGGTMYAAPATIAMQAYAFSANGAIGRVEFYDGANLLGAVTNAPYSFAWTNVGAGICQVKAVWYDDTGHSATSSAVTVTVVNPCAFTATPASGSAPLTVTFDSTGINPLTNRWDFGDGGSATGTVVMHTYANIGNYTATLTAIYAQGFSNSVSRLIGVASAGGNRLPTASFTASVTNGTAPLVVNFDASASNDADNDTLTHTWNWDVGDPSTGSGPIISHTYSNAGQYTATLTVDDGRGGQDNKSVTITVAPTGPCGVSGLATWFDATDVDGDGVTDAPKTQNVSVGRWTDKTRGLHDACPLAGSGVLTTNAIGTKPAVNFIAPNQAMMFSAYGLPCGTNPCTLLVAAKSRYWWGGMVVRYGTTLDSYANYREIGTPGSPGPIRIGQTGAALDAAMPAAYDSNANGKWDNGELLVVSGLWAGGRISGWANGQSLGTAPESVTYNTGNGMGYLGENGIGDIGEVLIYNRALGDAERQLVENYLIQKWVTQTEPPVNHEPVASFTVGASGQFKTFDASASSDVDGDTLAYTWAFGDNAVGSGVTAQHGYAATGSYTATLTVSDGRGGMSAIGSTFTVTITNSPAPQIVSLAATNITTTSAFLNASLASTGAAPTSVSVYWGTVSGGTNASSWANTHAFGVAPSDGPVGYTWQATGLTPGQMCLYRYCAQNVFGAAWTVEQSFTNLLPPAVNNTVGATNVTYCTATLRGQVTQGLPTPNVNVCWGTVSGGASTAAWQNARSIGPQSGAFTLSVAGLTAGATYYYRCEATNAVGDAWSSVTSLVCQTSIGGLSPVAWWSLDEGGGTSAFDRSGNGHTGVIAGSPASVAGEQGLALQFDGVNDSISVPGFNFTPRGEFTLAFWFNASTTNSAGTLFHNVWNPGSIWVYCSANTNGNLSVYTSIGTASFSTSGIACGTWHLYTLTGSAGGSAAFIDGVPSGTSTNNSGLSGSSTLYFGSRYGIMLFYNGKLDDIRIYDQALSPADVRVLAAGDGVTAFDVWRIRNLGGTNGPGTGASEDPDHDGMSNMQEYLAGTDPTNAVSVFAFSNVVQNADATNLVLSWHSASGKFYAIDFATSLMAGFTGILSSNIPATPTINTYTAGVNKIEEFYRIRVEQ